MKHYDDLLSRLRSATRLPMIQALCNEAAYAIEELMGAENAKTAKSAPTSDYISREAAINAIYEAYADGESAYDAIEHLPAADVRPVVLCKECKFWNRDYISCEGLARCLTGESGVRFRKANDFCSRGVKKEESDG